MSRRYRPAGGVPLPGFHFEERTQGPQYIVAIDFGTTRSAVASAIVQDDNSLVVNFPITTNHASSASEINIPNNQKSDTIICYGDDHSGIGLAYYSECRDEEDCEYFSARDFKMYLDVVARRRQESEVKLGETEVEMKSIHNSNTRRKPLLQMITDYLRQAGEIGFRQLLHTLESQGLDQPSKEKVMWVVTVPAIWTDQARIAMRQALVDANLVPSGDTFSKNISVCLEPEGAVLECIDQFQKTFPQIMLKDKTLLILDLGGGTTDITSHQVMALSRVGRMELAEVCPPQGGGWGGRLWNQRFDEKIMSLVLTPAAWENYQADTEGIRTIFYLETLNSIKNALRGERSEATKRIQLGDFEIKEDAQELLRNEFRDRPDVQRIRMVQKNSVLVVPEPLLCLFFDDVLDPLRTTLRRMLEERDYDIAFLVGGLGSNEYIFKQLQVFLDDVSPNTKLFTPPEAGLAIVRGAVRFGFDSSAFGSRKSRTNYGISVYNRSDPSESLFSLLIAKDADLRQVEENTKNQPLGPYSPVTAEQQTIAIQLYECDEVPQYISHDKCMFIASIHIDIDISVPFESRKFDIAISMNGTVIEGLVRQQSDGKQWPLKWSSR